MKFRIWINEDNFNQPRNFEAVCGTSLELFGALMDAPGPVWGIDVPDRTYTDWWRTVAITRADDLPHINIDTGRWGDPDYVERLAVDVWEKR